MMKKKKTKRRGRGTTEIPRLAVFKSNKNIYCQIIDDQNGTTLVAASSAKEEKTPTIEIAAKVGEEIGKKAIEKKIDKVVFDRRRFVYHGKVKALADGARKAGLKF